MKDSDIFETRDIEESKDGKVLKVAYIPEDYPLCYYDSELKRPDGIAIEILRRFALEHNYRLEFISSSTESAEIMLTQNLLDIAIAGLTEVYREDYEGMLCLTHPYLNNHVVLIKTAEGQKMELHGVINR